MKTQSHPWPLPPCIEAITFDGTTYAIEHPEDYADASLPPSVRTFFETRVIVADDPDAKARAEFEAAQVAAKEAEFARFKARAGQPTYKAAAVKVAAEKLGYLDGINATIMTLVNAAQDKSLYVWWEETDSISRGDAQWQQIEAENSKVDAAAVFSLAAQISTAAALSVPSAPAADAPSAPLSLWQRTKQALGFGA